MKKFKVQFEENIKVVSEVVIEARDKESAKRKFNDMSEADFDSLDCKDIDMECISQKIKKIEEV
jgi:hypothetical protein